MGTHWLLALALEQTIPNPGITILAILLPTKGVPTYRLQTLTCSCWSDLPKMQPA